MNIHFTSFSTYATSFLNPQVQRTLTAQHKKILVIASIAFACLAGCYILLSCCFKAKKQATSQPTFQQDCLKAIQLNPNLAIPYNNLATTLPNGGSIQLLDGTTMTKQQLFLKVLQIDPNLAIPYNNLATALPDGGSIQLLDGTTMTKQQLYLKALQLNPNLVSAYHNLAKTLPDGGSIQLLDGTNMTKQQLHLKFTQLQSISP